MLTFLQNELGLSLKSARELVWLGAVYVDDRRFRDESGPIEIGAHVRVHQKPRRFKVPELAKRIVRKEDAFYFVDKPAGIPTHGLVDNIRENLITALSEELHEELFITHRLDVETSGLLIVARNREAQARLNAQIAAKDIRRFYRACVTSNVKPGRYVHFLEPSPKAPKRVSREARDNWLRCELEVLSSQEIEGPPQAFELEIELFTGRSQQIRAQLAALGSPIIGDVKYGSGIELREPLTGGAAIALRADRIAGL